MSCFPHYEKSEEIYMGMRIKMSYLPPLSSFFSPSPEIAWPDSRHFVLLLSMFLFVMAVCISFLFHFMSHLYNYLRALCWSSFMQYSPHSWVFMSEEKLQLIEPGRKEQALPWRLETISSLDLLMLTISKQFLFMFWPIFTHIIMAEEN